MRKSTIFSAIIATVIFTGAALATAYHLVNQAKGQVIHTQASSSGHETSTGSAAVAGLNP